MRLATQFLPKLLRFYNRFLKTMEKIKNLLKDLNEINKIFEATYGKSGKSALIQFTNKDSQINSFTTTNDGNSILSTMSFFQNNVLKLFFNTIKNHSASYGDGCKTLFFYAFQIIESLATLENLDTESVMFSLRTNGIADVYQVIYLKFKFTIIDSPIVRITLYSYFIRKCDF